MNIEKYIERKIKGLNVLRYSNPLYLPGSIIDTKEFDRRVGHAKDLIKNTPTDFWEVHPQPGSILLEENISGSHKIGAGGNFLGIFNFKSNIKAEYELDYEIDQVVSSEFKTANQILLEIELDKLKKSDRTSWQALKGRTIITTSYFAKSFTLMFKRSGKVSAQVEVEKDINVNAEVKAEWLSEGEIRISGNELVPFGVLGFKIR
ncbi:MAG: hypothetical protein IPM74_03615 [Crocinitomicaceae bacterium]|nr:hypothetical protein [Crocinitomicaceae bacterium]MBK8925001.1 hypothetical protein [Crocinitomicaceae bacterium]